MLLDRLRDAKALRKRKLLEPILEQCEEKELGDHKEVKHGNFILRVVIMKEGTYSCYIFYQVLPGV